MHLLQVPDTLLAERFYAQALGLTADPGSTGPQRGGVGVTWYIGKQQVSQHIMLPCKAALAVHVAPISQLQLPKVCPHSGHGALQSCSKAAHITASLDHMCCMSLKYMYRLQCANKHW